ncbi:hypothetical protein BH24ACT26_BH24ACT26_10560 [soil metagenome]
MLTQVQGASGGVTLRAFERSARMEKGSLLTEGKVLG